MSWMLGYFNVTDISIRYVSNVMFNNASISIKISVTGMFQCYVTICYLLLHAFNFNQDISNWDVSSVTDMRGMFYDQSRYFKLGCFKCN